jgi:hypothetical protein
METFQPLPNTELIEDGGLNPQVMETAPETNFAI